LSALPTEALKELIARASSIEDFQPAISPSEFQRRLAGVRDLMRERSLDLLLLFAPENVTYLTGYETIGYSSFLCLLVPADGELLMVVREMELEVAAATTWLDRLTVAQTARTRSTWRSRRSRRWRRRPSPSGSRRPARS
jgi:Xaa-Pro aminopeptidase